MRNPFPKIGKVIKYEFKHSARILLPMYGVLLVLGLFVGLSVNKTKYQETMDGLVNGIDNARTTNNDFNLTWSIDGSEINGIPAKGAITGILMLLVFGLTIAVIVTTIVTLARRFKQSMLGDEAYLNLSLPVTMGEQLWGRFIMNFLWVFCSFLVIAITFILCFIKMDIFYYLREFLNELPEVNEELAKHGLSFGKIIWTVVIIGVFFTIWIISMLFAVNAVGHLFKNNKGIIKFVAVIVLFWLWGKTIGLASVDVQLASENAAYYFTRNSIIVCCVNFIWSAIYFAFTQYVFTYRLNLE